MNKNAFVKSTLTSNPEASMAEIVAIFTKEMGINETRARAYFNWGAKELDMLGRIERKVKAKSTKAPKAKTPQKARADRSALKVAQPVKDLTVEELQDLKDRNLARLKAIGQKYNKAQAQQKLKVNAAPEAADELPSFSHPEFLTADEVRALV